MDPATLDALTVTALQGLTPVPGAVSLDGGTNTVTFAPTTPLGLGLLYTITITTGAKDLGGQPLAADYTWTFTTATCSLGPIDLRSAGGFAVLAGSTVTSGGPTLIAGDLGVSPGTAITGFPPGTVVGTQHAGDPTAAQGIADLVTAYNDAKGRTLCAVTLAGNLGGLTLTPGLYTSTSSLAISAGDLTLDAQQDSDAIFIFQTASTLTTTVGRQVVLINGAKASNVFWQVGSFRPPSERLERFFAGNNHGGSIDHAEQWRHVERAGAGPHRGSQPGQQYHRSTCAVSLRAPTVPGAQR